jgi:hypothetical protein
MMMEYKMMKHKKMICKKMQMRVIQCFKKIVTVTWMTNSGVVLSNPNPRSVVRRPATPHGFNSANWNTSSELVDNIAAIIAGPPVGGMPLMAKSAIVDKNNGGGKQSAISWEKDVVVVRLNFAAKTFHVKQGGQETTCCAVLLVEHKPAVALKYLYDHHFGNALVREWINKSLAVRKAVVGWSSLEAYGKRMNWPVKPVSSSTPIA